MKLKNCKVGTKVQTKVESDELYWEGVKPLNQYYRVEVPPHEQVPKGTVCTVETVNHNGDVWVITESGKNVIYNRKCLKLVKE